MNEQAFKLLMAKLNTIDSAIEDLRDELLNYKTSNDKEVGKLKVKTAKLMAIATIFGFSGAKIEKVIFKKEKTQIKQSITKGE